MNKVKSRLALLLAVVFVTGSLQGPVFAVQRTRAGADTASTETGTEDSAQITETEALDLEAEPMDPGTPPDDPGGEETEYYTVRVEMDGGYGGIYHGSIYDDALGKSVMDASSFTKKVKKGEALEFMEGSLYIEGEQPHDFLGWSLEQDGEIVGTKTSYTPTADCTLYAVWTSHITFYCVDEKDHFPDGSRGKTVYADRDGWVTLPEDPVTEKKGWKFYCWIWSDSTDEVEVVDGRVHIDHTRTLNPDWRDIKVETVTLDRTVLDLEIGETAQLNVTSILPEDALTKEITWKSSDELTATVDENGLVTGVRRGTTTIKAFVWDGGGSMATCTVNVDGGKTLVTFDANGGAFSGRFYDSAQEAYVEDPVSFSIQDLGYGASFSSGQTILNSDPSMRFRGWSLEAGGEPVIGKYENYKTDKSVTLYAVWEPVYVVNIDMNGGCYLALVHDDALGEDVTSPGSFVWEVKKGEALAFDENRIYYSYEDTQRGFIGWSLEPGGEIVGTKTGYTPAADCTLYANWTKYACFVPQGGSFADGTASVRNMADENGMVELPAQVPVCDDENREFGGWTLTEGGEPVEANADGCVRITEDCTFIPLWKDKTPAGPEDPEEDTWTVRIDFNGGYYPGSRFDDEKQEYVQLPSAYVKKVKKGESLGEYVGEAKITDRHRQLAGWSLEPDGEIVASAATPHAYVPTGNCTLYAVWGDAYCVTQDLDGGHFEGSIWDDENRQYVKNPGTAIVKILCGQERSLHYSSARAADPSLILIGWSLEKNGENVTTSHKGWYKPESDCTLYPIWAKAHTVTIDLNGAHYKESEWDDVVGGSVVNPEKLQKIRGEGEKVYLYSYNIVHDDPEQMLVGWSLERDGEIVLAPDASSYTVEDDCTLYAVWDRYYTVTVDFDGGWNAGSVYDDALKKTVTDAPSYVKKIRRGDAITLNPHSAWFLGEHQHDFAGWSLEKGGTLLEDNTSFTPTSDCTIYAVWTSHAVFYSVGGHFPSGDITIRADVDENGKVQVPEEIPVCDDTSKVFDGWCLSGTDQKIDVDQDGKTPIQYNVTFNPVWADKPKDTWTVIFDAGGGHFSDGRTQISTEIKKGEITRFSSEPSTEEDKLFAGWETQDGALVESVFYYIPSGNEVLKAVWSDYYTVTFDPAGGKLNYNNYRVNKVVKGRTLNFGRLDATYTDDEKLFVGWCLEGEDTVLEDQRYFTPQQDTTMVAKWADACTVTFDCGQGYYELEWWDNFGEEMIVGRMVYNRLVYKFPKGYRFFDAVRKEIVDDPYYDDATGSQFYAEAHGSGEDYWESWYFYHPKSQDVSSQFRGWKLSDGTTFTVDDLKDFVPEQDTTFTAIWHTEKKVDKITLNQTSLALNIGKTAALSATVSPSDADDPSVTWTSSNTKVAAVSSAGKVTAVAKGTATLTATAKDGSGVKASCTVTVKQPVTKITLNKTSLAVNVAKTAALTATAAPASANNKTLKWTTSNRAVATVTSKGVVKGIKKGTATITATAADGSGVKAACKVTVKQPVTGLKISKTSLSLNRGKTATLKVTVSPTTANNKTLKWTTSNKAVATVTSKGVVKGIKKGTATITATAADGSGKKVTCRVTVKQPVTALKISRTSLSLNKGKTATLKVTVSPTTANNKTLKWTTSNKAVATVTSKGVVKGIKKGTATITATAADGSGKKVTCRVTVK